LLEREGILGPAVHTGEPPRYERPSRVSINSVAVYCASSPKVDGEYLRVAGDLGRELASAGWTTIYGGGAVGLMGAVADAVLDAGGKIIGVRPRFINQIEPDRKGLTETVFTETMHERLGVLMKRSDAFVALPGACGTLHEVIEAITWKRLGLHNKPVILLNQDRFFDPLVQMFEQMITQRFVSPSFSDLYHVCADAVSVVRYLRAYEPPPLAPL